MKVFGKWVYVMGAGDPHPYHKVLGSMKSSWVELSPTSDAQTVTLRWGDHLLWVWGWNSMMHHYQVSNCVVYGMVALKQWCFPVTSVLWVRWMQHFPELRSHSEVSVQGTWIWKDKEIPHIFNTFLTLCQRISIRPQRTPAADPHQLPAVDRFLSKCWRHR